MKSISILVATILVTIFSGCGDDEFSARHNQGKNCLECHSFTSGVTIFTTLHAKDKDETLAARDNNIQLKLDTGKVIKFSKGNGYGNFKYSGDKDEIVTFTAQVIDENGTVINQSRENSHDLGRLACNRCHSQEGMNGAPGRVVNFVMDNAK